MFGTGWTRVRKSTFLLAALAASLWASPAAAAEIIVSAAASLTQVFAEVAKAYEKANPGLKVHLNFGGSGALLQQIARGAPVDVFASADQETMDRADRQGLIAPGSRHDFARNALVVAAPKGAKSAPGSLAELKAPGFARLAISNPDGVPAGRYAREVLEANGLWDLVKGKSLNTQNVRQSLDYLARGEADAGIVYATDVAIMPEKVAILFEVQTRDPILYPIAAVKGSGKEAQAMQFIDFVRSGAGQTILVRYGFRIP